MPKDVFSKLKPQLDGWIFYRYEGDKVIIRQSTPNKLIKSLLNNKL